MKQKKEITPQEMIELIRKLPDADEHIFKHNNKYYVTDEWLVGSFAGSSFSGNTLEEAAEELIKYLHRHIAHNSIVGDYIRKSGFPDLKKIKIYYAKKYNNGKR